MERVLMVSVIFGAGVLDQDATAGRLIAKSSAFRVMNSSDT